jgi:hypothetical protein
VGEFYQRDFGLADILNLFEEFLLMLTNDLVDIFIYFFLLELLSVDDNRDINVSIG